jgi:hypothetical protein
MIKNDDEDPNFARNFEDATNYILFAAVACQRLRVNEEVTRRSKLRWFGVFADLYDRYRSIVNTMPELIDNQDVARAMEIAEDVRRDKLKRNALAKEAMAGRRINRLLTALRGQWHIIDLHDNITREFLINNTNEFFDALIDGINWPENVNHLPYKSLSSGSDYQYILEKGESGGSGETGGSEERNKRKLQGEEKSGSRKKQKRSKKKFTLEIPEYLNYNKNETESEDDSEVGSETEAKKPPAEVLEIEAEAELETEEEAKKPPAKGPEIEAELETEEEAKKPPEAEAELETEEEAKKPPAKGPEIEAEAELGTEEEAKKALDAPADEPENNLIQL